MRQHVLALSFLSLAACSSLSWKGRETTSNTNPEGVDPRALANGYESRAFYSDVRRRMDGRSNAFGRDMLKIVDFIDRHFWNYDADDPYVNYSTDTTWFQQLGRFTLYEVSSVPGMDSLLKK
jgi:hypothetical protein